MTAIRVCYQWDTGFIVDSRQLQQRKGTRNRMTIYAKNKLRTPEEIGQFEAESYFSAGNFDQELLANVIAQSIRAYVANYAAATTPLSETAVGGEAESGCQFPIHSTDRHLLKSVPWALVEAHRKQAHDNHDQSLERLAERGGLGLRELFAVLNNRSWRPLETLPSDEESLKWIKERVAEFAVPVLAAGDEIEYDRRCYYCRNRLRHDTKLHASTIGEHNTTPVEGDAAALRSGEGS